MARPVVVILDDWQRALSTRPEMARLRERADVRVYDDQAATPDELARRLADPDPPLVLDARSRSEEARDRSRIPGSVRVVPDQVAAWAAAHPEARARPVVAYCT